MCRVPLNTSAEICFLQLLRNQYTAFFTSLITLSTILADQAQSVDTLDHSKFSRTKICPHHGNFGDSRMHRIISFNFLARSCKILQIRGYLGKNLGKILTKKSRNIQDSYQELQEFLHWATLGTVILKLCK